MAGQTENGWKLPVVFNCRSFPNSLTYRDH